MTKNVSVPEGYKKTELGVIPEDWEVVKLQNITDFHKQGYYTKEKYVESGTKILRITDIDNIGNVHYETMPHLKVSDKDYENYKLEFGDFVFARSGVSIGRVGLIRDAEKAIFGSYIIKFKFNSELLQRECFVRYFNSIIFHKELFKKIQGASNPNINAENIKKCRIILPPFSEQQKIASILSKVDEQIEQTEQIIEKTELLKKGLMQKLLTKGIGHTKFKKTELGEIPEEWSIVKQEEVVSFYNGRAYKLSEWEKTGTPVIRLQNLTGTGSEYYYSNLKLPLKQYVNKGDLLYMWSASFGPYIWNGPKAIFHYHIWKIECSDKMDKLFMYYLLNKTTELMKSKMNGMAILHITKSGMEKQKISLPPLPEQQKISSILSKLDFQIQDNQNYLTKLQELKKGLMQDLLTGKVRVCV